MGNCGAKTITGKQSSTKKAFEFNDVIPSKFGFRGFNGNWISPTEFTFTESGSFKKFDMVTLVNQTVLSKEFLVRFKDYLLGVFVITNKTIILGSSSMESFRINYVTR